MKKLLGCLALLAACSFPDVEPGSRVKDFRLIAVAADKPFVAPGETVKLTTLYHEPYGRPITWAWTTCPLPRDTTVNGCLARLSELAQQGALPTFATGVDQSSFEVTVPPNILEGLPPAVRSSATVGVVTIACPGTLAPRDLATLPTGELPFTCTDAGQVLPYERWVFAVKRIFLFERDKNANPPITSVTWDGAPWVDTDIKEIDACDKDTNTYLDCESSKHQLVVSTPPESIEGGVSEYGTPFRESVVYQYYATEGLFEFSVKTAESPVTHFAARKQSKGLTLDMWLVVRDNRGGVSWTTRQVRVR